MNPTERLEELRAKLDAVDKQVACLLSTRLEIVEEIGDLKAQNNLPVLDKARENRVKEKVASQVKDAHKGAVKAVYQTLMDEAKRLEETKN